MMPCRRHRHVAAAQSRQHVTATRFAWGEMGGEGRAKEKQRVRENEESELVIELEREEQASERGK